MNAEEPVRALNYSTHALEDLALVRTMMLDSGDAQEAATLGNLMRLLEQSQKFLLPNCCELIAPGDLREAHVELARLPFACTAFEAPWETGEWAEHEVAGFDQIPVTRRIALCWEPAAFEDPTGLGCVDRLVDKYPGGGCCILPIYWSSSVGRWVPAAGGLFAPYEGRYIGHSDRTFIEPASRMAMEGLVAHDAANAKGQLLAHEPFILFPTWFERMVADLGHDRALSSIILDAQDESRLQLEVCAVLACANVELADLDAPAKLNAKRRKSGKRPFFSYKLLALDANRSARGRVDPQGGAHASPRMHLRRGHLRRLGPGRSVWVRAAVIGAHSRTGVVEKDYEVRTDEPGARSVKLRDS